MIIDHIENSVYLRYRDKNNERVEEVIRDYKPYLYIKEWVWEREFNELYSTSISHTNKWGKGNTYRLDFEKGEWVNLQKESLVKVYYGTPKDRWSVMERLEQQGIEVFQGDVDIKRIYTVDRMNDIKKYNLRKWHLDIETQVGGTYDKCITVISLYDNFTDQHTVMTWFPSPIRDYTPKDWIEVYHDESDLLNNLVEKMQRQDPDMIIGWYVLGYDIPHIIKRMCALNINPNLMSPLNEIKRVSRTYNAAKEPNGWKLNVEKYYNSDQPIKGRLTFCLMDRFERLWTDSQMGTLPSLKLDDCAKLVLDGDGKVVSAKFEDLEFYERSWLEDTDVYLEYAYVDVELTKRIDEKMNISENSLALQQLMICPFECTYHNSQMGGIYFMRNAGWIPPTGKKGSKEKFEAAFVINPKHEKTNGLYENIAVFDFKSLYPSMMASVNISWETKRNDGYPVWYDMPKTLKDFEGEPDIYYQRDNYGLLPKAVMDMMELREEYKVKRKEAETDDEYRKWDSAQMATKRAVNAFYGILAKDGYAWGDMEMAKSITASARYAMRSVAFKAQEMGYKVIYGHTDSIFVQVKDVDDAKNLKHVLDMYISTEIFRKPVELEFEKFASKFFLAAKKNRYCGWLSWKDGEYLDEEKFMVMGFEMKKSNETKLAKKFQETLLKMVSKGKSHKEIIDYCNKIYAEVIKGQVNIKEISKRSRLRRNLEDYDMIAGGTAGIVYYNQQKVSNVKIEKGDSYYFFKMDNDNLEEKAYLINGKSKSAEYISFRKFKEIENKFNPDWKFIAEAEVIKKSSLILESMGWSIKEYKRDVNQTTLDSWW
mgnify:CR=1 FL=1|tara:strand:- start:8450 stop:10915 length:2466 start_codon:yes stop_codon:yes gene_type:complete